MIGVGVGIGINAGGGSSGSSFNPTLEYSPDPTLATAANFTLLRSSISGGNWVSAGQTSPIITLGGSNSAVTTAALKAGTYRFAFTVSGWSSGNNMTCTLDVGGSGATNTVSIAGGNGSYTCDVVLAADAAFNNFRLNTSLTNTWSIGPISLKRTA